jgi:hypothetical protein
MIQKWILAFCGIAVVVCNSWAETYSKEDWQKWLEKENTELRTSLTSPLAIISVENLKTDETIYLSPGKKPHSVAWSAQPTDSKNAIALRYAENSLTYRLPEDSAFKPIPSPTLETREGFSVLPGKPRPEGIKLWVKDPKNPTMSNFKGARYYDFDPAFVIQARFEPITPPEALQLPRSQGDTLAGWKVGRARFKLKDSEVSLEIYVIGKVDSRVATILFTDETNGKTTYSAGRNLEFTLNTREASPLTLDFNRAFQPYCAYNHAYSCALPPSANRIHAPIRAGQRWSKK